MHDSVRAQVAQTIPAVSTETATFIRFDGAMCVVRDALGVEQSWRWAGTVIPAPGDSVQIQSTDGQHVVLGRTLPTPTQGTVAAVSATALTINVVVGPSPITAAFMGAPPAVGDVVALSYGYEGFIAMGRASYTPPKVEVPTEPAPPAVKSHTKLFRATVMGNWYRGSWGSGRGIVSDGRNTGIHYGPVLGATLPDDAEIVSGRIYLPTDQVRYPLAPGIQALAAAPPAADGVGASGILAARSGWVGVQIGILEQLRVGNRGLRIFRRDDGSGNGTHDIYKSLAADPMSGALEITWRS